MHVSALALLLAQIAAILLTARVLGVVARRLGQPLVIAEITAGIVLGPSLLGNVWPAGMAALFPATSLPPLQQLAHVGLVLFMFLIGLELDPAELRGQTRAAIAIANASILVPALLGFGTAVWLHDAYAPAGVGVVTFGLFLAVAMSVTAFPVLARILSEQNLRGTRVGALAIACAAVNDVVAWFLLAFIVAVAHAGAYAEAGWTIGASIAYIAIMVFVVRPFLGRLGARVSEGTTLTPGIVAIAFFGLLVSAAATEMIGIHALFGAFLFGAVLPKQHGLAAGLVDRIESVATILLLPLFFAASGLRTEIALVATPRDAVVAGLLIVVATVGKFGGSAVAARLTGSPWREASAIGVLMNTRGLMELIVLNVGLELGVITPAIFTMLVLMALVTTIATAPIVRRLHPTYPIHGRRQAPRKAAAPTGFSALACVANPGDGKNLLAILAALRGAEPQAPPTFVLHLAPPTDRASEEPPAADDPEGPLAPLLERATALGLRATPITFVSADRARDIVATAASHGASLVLLGAHKPLFLEHEMGGTVAGVFGRATQDVAVLDDRGLGEVKRVLYAPGDEPANAPAAALAQRLEAGGVAVTTLRTDAATREATILAEAARGYDLLLTALAPRPIFGDSPISVLVVGRGRAGA